MILRYESATVSDACCSRLIRSILRDEGDEPREVGASTNPDA